MHRVYITLIHDYTAPVHLQVYAAKLQLIDVQWSRAVHHMIL